jgi:hypothetical protein
MREADLIRPMRNVIYCGKLREGEQVYKGEHAEIVDADLWQRANAAINGQPPSARAEARSCCPGATPEQSGGITESVSVPRISRLLALALRMEQMMEEGRVKTYSELAQLGQVSTARITQIMNLLHLAPDIQEQILSPDAAQAGLCEVSRAEAMFGRAVERAANSLAEWTIGRNSAGFGLDSRIENRDIEMGTLLGNRKARPAPVWGESHRCGTSILDFEKYLSLSQV